MAVVERCGVCGTPLYGDYCPACYPAEDDQGPEEGIAERREGPARVIDLGEGRGPLPEEGPGPEGDPKKT